MKTILDYFDKTECIPDLLDEGMHDGTIKQILDDATAVYNEYSRRKLNLLVGTGDSKYLSYDLYSITLTFKPKYHFKDPEELHGMFRKEIIRYSFKCLTEIEFFAYPEFTPKNHTLHYHGILLAPPLVRMKLKAWLGRHWGFIQLKEVFDLSSWLEYISKAPIALTPSLAVLKRRRRRIAPPTIPVEVRETQTN